MTLRSLLPGLLLLFVGCTSSGERGTTDGKDAAAPDDSGGPTIAVPTVCFGRRTRCDAPDFEPVTPRTSTTVECTDGAAYPVLWKQKLGTFACTLPACPAADPEIAVGKDAYLAVADINEPIAGQLLGGQTVGFVLLAYGADGAQTTSVVSDVRRKVDGPFDQGTTRHLRTSADGGVLWIAPTPDAAGLELRQFSPKLERTATHVVVDGASALFGDAAWLTDGSAVVAYRYSEAASDGSTPRLLPGIARFDRDGHLVWNQTMLTALANADTSIVALATTLAGADQQGDVVLRVGRVLRDTGAPTTTDLVKLDADGNVMWAKEFADTVNFAAPTANAAVLGDGTVVFVSSRPENSGRNSYFDALDADGNALDRVELDPGFGATAPGVTFDGTGRALLASGTDHATTLYVVDREDPMCSMHAVDAPSCVYGSDGTQQGCDAASITLTPSGDLFYGLADSVGVVDLP